MQKLFTLALIGLLTLAFATPASAGHCNGTVTDIGGTAYLEDRGGVPYIYIEANGVPGLQSGGQNLFGYQEDCDHPNPDFFIY